MSAAAFIPISDPDDPRISEFCDIRERDLTGRHGRFIAEGTVVLRVLAQAHAAGRGIRAEKILLLANRVAGLEEILSGFPPDVPVYVADGPVLDAIAGFHLHRGVLALGARVGDEEIGSCLDSLPEKALVVAACGISNHDNIGSVFRNSAAFGVDAVILDQSSCDPLYRKALRVSVGSVLTVPYVRGGSAEDNLEALARAGFAIWALSPTGETEIRDIPASDRIALVLGTEGEGLSPTVLSRFNTARIAQSPRLDSLNVGTACGIALYSAAMAQGRL